jgi:DNA-binding XRE family transcriptional regulator
MKNAICNGGCKKGECNGDCKRTLSSKKSGQTYDQISKYPEHDKIGYDLNFELIGTTISKARKERDLSKTELGWLAGVKKSQISKIEKRFLSARFDSIIKVLKALNLEINIIYEPDKLL